MDLGSAQGITAALRGRGTSGLPGFVRTAGGPATITPRQAGTAVGISLGTGPYDYRIALRVMNSGPLTAAFEQQVRRYARDVDQLMIGPMSATDPFTDAPRNVGAHPPLVPGTSVGNAREDSAGTLAGFVLDGQGNLHALSNNHVLALSMIVNEPPTAMVGDPILQPGRRDGGFNPHDQVAKLSDWVPLNPLAINYVDCAMARLPDNYYVFDAVYVGRRVQGWRAPIWNEPVLKVGRTTEVTHGFIDIPDGGEFTVNYRGFPIYFDGLMTVKSATTGRLFSKRGDSGSLIIAKNDGYAVGLLFAANGSATLACPLDSVYGALGVTPFF